MACIDTNSVYKKTMAATGTVAGAAGAMALFGRYTHNYPISNAKILYLAWPAGIALGVALIASIIMRCRNNAEESLSGIEDREISDTEDEGKNAFTDGIKNFFAYALASIAVTAAVVTQCSFNISFRP